MRTWLYATAAGILILGSLGMAFLARIAPGIWLFGLGGAVLSGLITAAWVLLGATAEGLPRLRTGRVLMATGLAALLLNLYSRLWWPSAWSFAVLIAGAGFTFRPSWLARPHREANDRRPPGPVRPPLGRREQI